MHDSMRHLFKTNTELNDFFPVSSFDSLNVPKCHDNLKMIILAQFGRFLESWTQSYANKLHRQNSSY